jgi:hypothetical protein
LENGMYCIKEIILCVSDVFLRIFYDDLCKEKRN